MALISTLTDNFDDNSIDAAKWTTSITNSMTVLEANQEIEVTSMAGTGMSFLVSQNTYDLTASQSTIKVVDSGNQAISTWEWIYKLGNTTSDQEGYVFLIGGGNLVARIKDYNGASIAYNATNQRYLRIREAGGRQYWDYSANGSSWTNLYSDNSGYGGQFTSLKVYLGGGTYGSESVTTTAKVDDFNILPSAYNGQLMMIT